MDFPIHIDTISMEPSIVYIKGLQVDFSKLWCSSTPEGCVNFNKQCRPRLNTTFRVFHLGLHCLTKYPFKGFQYTKD